MNKELLESKLALIQMIHQFMYTKEIDGEIYYDHYCESAGEKAFRTLNLKGPLVKAKELCELEEKLSRELWAINLPNKEYNGFLAIDGKGIYY